MAGRIQLTGEPISREQIQKFINHLNPYKDHTLCFASLFGGSVIIMTDGSHIVDGSNDKTPA